MSEKTELCIGDYVFLNSGGPAPRVVSLKNKTVEVEWHNEVDRLETTVFPRVCIRQYAQNSN